MKDLGIIFENNSDCYADIDQGWCEISVMAMTKEKFIQVVKDLLEQSHNTDYETAKPKTCPDCDGCGEIESGKNDPKECVSCKGTGQVFS